MSRGGRRLKWGSEPTTTSNLDGIWGLNEINNLIDQTKWPRGPQAPTNLTVTANSTQLVLNWTSPSTTYGTLTNYLVEYTPNGGSAITVLTGSTSTSYTLTGLTNGTAYAVRVAAVNFVAGNFSSSVSGTPVVAGLTSLSGNYTGLGTQASPFRGSVDGTNLFQASSAGTIYWSVRGHNTSGDQCGEFRLYINGTEVLYRDQCTGGGGLISNGSRSVSGGTIIGWDGLNLDTTGSSWVSNPGFSIYLITS